MASLQQWMFTQAQIVEEDLLNELENSLSVTFEQDFEDTPELFGEDDEEFISSMWFLAQLYADKAKCGDAQPRFEKAPSTMEGVLGPQNQAGRY